MGHIYNFQVLQSLMTLLAPGSVGGVSLHQSNEKMQRHQIKYIHLNHLNSSQKYLFQAAPV